MKPSIVKEWESARDTIEGWTPKCCWTCSHFKEENLFCLEFIQFPPKEFLKEVDKCKYWSDEPF